MSKDKDEKGEAANSSEESTVKKSEEVKATERPNESNSSDNPPDREYYSKEGNKEKTMEVDSEISKADQFSRLLRRDVRPQQQVRRKQMFLWIKTPPQANNPSKTQLLKNVRLPGMLKKKALLLWKAVKDQDGLQRKLRRVRMKIKQAKN